jgi:hypothetical protein
MAGTFFLWQMPHKKCTDVKYGGQQGQATDSLQVKIQACRYLA